MPLHRLDEFRLPVLVPEGTTDGVDRFIKVILLDERVRPDSPQYFLLFDKPPRVAHENAQGIERLVRECDPFPPFDLQEYPLTDVQAIAAELI